MLSWIWRVRDVLPEEVKFRFKTQKVNSDETSCSWLSSIGSPAFGNPPLCKPWMESELGLFLWNLENIRPELSSDIPMLFLWHKKEKQFIFFFGKKKKKKDKNQSIGNKCQVLVANRSSQLSLTRQFWGVTWLGFYHLASPRCYLAPKTAVSFCEPPHFLTTPFFWKKKTRISVPFVVKNAGWQNSDWRLRRGVAGTGGRETIPSCGTTFSYPCDEGRHTCQNHLLKGL